MVKFELIGSTLVTCGKYKARTIMALARALRKDGFPDQPIECWRDGKKVLTYRSLFWASDHTIHEEPRLHVTRYREGGKEDIGMS